MALQSAYQQFLATPNSSLLADHASLHYITTLTSIHGSGEIIKHLRSQDNELKKNEQKVLDAVEASDALVVEVQTALEFQTGGGAYLPSLDDNFLADRKVTFPIIHIVSFTSDGKISQIRQSWDQGSLLKLIDVIGKTGRNWPIQDGKDQIKLIVSSVKSAGKPTTSTAEEPVHRSRGNSTNVTGDPHASLSLFAPRQKTDATNQPTVVNQKASIRPPPREYSELFVSGDSFAPTANESARDQSESPSKFAKAGASKNYAPSRLFDHDEDEREDVVQPLVASGQQGTRNFYRPNPKRYDHFDMTDASAEEEETEQKQKPLKGVQAKHGSQWNFDDFNTPQKHMPAKVLRTNDVRHWGNSDDELVETPAKRKNVDKPRKDAETHFEFVDDGTPDGTKRLVNRPRGAGSNNGLGLYKNNLYDDENGGTAGGEEFKQSNTLANVKDRRKDFEPHFAMTDNSPATQKPSASISDNKAKVVKMMDANWAYHQSPQQKENVPASPTVSRPNPGAKAPLSEATNMMSHRNDNPKGINIGGDGMGGKKGAGRSWGFGDDSDGEVQPKFKSGKAQKDKPTGGDFWDF